MPALPGVAADTFARALAGRRTPVLKQPMVVDNRPGASAMIAAKAVMLAPGDGYTLLYGTASTTVMVSALEPDLGVDFTKDLAPVATTFFGGVEEFRTLIVRDLEVWKKIVTDATITAD